MNIIKTLSVIAFSALVFTGCKNTDKDGTIASPDSEIVTDNAQNKETAANLETATFKIDGMMCPMGCAATIENKLSGLDGVAQAKVDFDNKLATVSFDAKKQSTENLVKTVEDIADHAYTVSDVKTVEKI
ncbi:heavy-metal-associated domain-containing protein [Flavobacterium rhizosphaerae]|uniref:Heavy metal-associated domain-containing protein n=1 Tax=Flavobacterium rhizosphaerae TaxID=3163298 RepID=A0ABW8YWG3_9FLAO